MLIYFENIIAKYTAFKIKVQNILTICPLEILLFVDNK